MQVKRRINQFFENILRKDKKLEEEESPTSTIKSKRRWRGKVEQTHSQWDLIEHIVVEEEEDEDKVEISNVQLQLNFVDQENETVCGDGQDLIEPRPKESFLKRSGSLLRRSMRRKKKPKNAPALEKDESFTNIVQQINETLNEVAALGRNGNENQFLSQSQPQPSGDENIFICHVQVEPEPDSRIQSPITRCADTEPEVKLTRKDTFKVGLKRQASKLASKFQKSPGSMRLRSASFDSVHSSHYTAQRRQRSSSLSVSNSDVNAAATPTGIPGEKRPGSFRRKMSFKKAKKFMTKGMTTFGKNMMHASAVMPIAYESPPTSFYPEYDNSEEYPSELAQCYYRTLSYQPKESNGYDKYYYNRPGGLHGHQTVQQRPTSFYQHGFCYNG